MDLKSEKPRRSLWQRIVDFALTDVSTIVDGAVDESVIERLEQVLIEADFGVDLSMELVSELERWVARGKIRSEADLRSYLGTRIRDLLSGSEADSASWAEGDDHPPGPGLRDCLHRDGPLGIVLMLGVNGVGKTTTVAKLAHGLHAGGERVLLAAADTFRAGAQEQLRAWADRVGAEFVGGSEGADPASVAFDAVRSARARGMDWALIDTAGRLHTQSDLVKELEKIDRVIGRQVPGAPHERLLVVDATSGQNVLNQARQFGAALPLTGLVLAKFDSSARAGTVVSVVRELAVPVRFLGVGEKLDDLEPFSPRRYVDKILSTAP